MKLKSLLPKFNKIYLLPALSGALLTLTLPPYNISLFLWPAFIPLFIFIDKYRLELKQIFWGGFLTGFIYAVKAVYPLLSLNAWWWVDVKSIVYENRIIFLFWIFFIITIYNSVLFGLYMLAFKKFNKNNWLAVIIFPLLWASLEYFRAKTLLDFSWGHLGYALYNNIYILQLARIFKLFGLSFFIMLINILLYQIICKINLSDIYDFKKYYKKIYIAIFKNPVLYFLLVIILAANLYGFYSINASRVKTGEKIAVAIIQPGMETEEMTLDYYFNNFVKIINTALVKKPDLLIIPENSFPFLILNQDNNLLPLDYNNDAKIKKSFDDLINLSRDNPHTSFVIGVHTIKNMLTYNSLIVLENGQINGLYSKKRLLPFSESSRPVLFLQSIEPLGTGDNDQEIKIKGEPITALLCSEIMFAELSENKEAKFIVNIGNDSVFTSPSVAEQNHIMAIIRAVENNKYVFRAMKTGVSGIIDPSGQILKKSNSNNEPQILFIQNLKN
ncbi:apolipoprotein N-acyltransferase [Candidatus Falkowbacteria bacterium CG_4_10_14_0_2_um_filter_36_22]|uniref:Apolipoprotein N-acyltransferase n=2 Tax=Candidatus Falkowiibacteriota TaxID=1752728 RepID=A0A1J4T7X2_9BACT|nr:MAG: apolipoprotein N-acyltransferase [Candidatus Falkowbacteria bacterium CG1_02_37_44]PIV52078.1 MAG: apolipoprotein N-acyltransferase [Candidatus Falkowbacteria bacterium CG02_land_8_20_14_3_00_36_14]PIX11480.1 MAG: apolipoprotein N-acyltransferase [Candidatus Falkowbacteria bacterium CG_4_8_14_3_um_filter_36_11]PJA10909.1 MAG: apolipoprotein N-acyltransferase [Candidatus Falkowbacteria bacterium CG_4_10_14_0_2_um_filter_36_22]